MNSNTNIPNKENFIPQRENIIESIYNYIAKLIVPVFIKLNFSANFITILSGLIGILGSSLVLLENSFYNVLAFIFLNVFVILDLVDGDIARYTNTSSLFGRWLDLFFDKLNEIVLIYALIFTAYKSNFNINNLYLGLLLVTMYCIYQFIILANLYWFDKKESTNEKILLQVDPKIQKNTWFSANAVLVHLTLKHSTLFFIASFGILFNSIHLTIYILVIMSFYSVFLISLRNFVKLRSK